MRNTFIPFFPLGYQFSTSVYSFLLLLFFCFVYFSELVFTAVTYATFKDPFPNVPKPSNNANKIIIMLKQKFKQIIQQKQVKLKLR